jgi:hypothetical protein
MTRRMTLIVLALIGLMVLVVTVAPPDPGVRGGEKPSTDTVARERSVERLSDPDAFDVSKTLSAASDAKDQTVGAELGDRVEITVEGDTPDTVMLGDLDVEEVDAGLPARFEVLADTPGSYPLILLNEERQIGTLQVR